MDHTKLVVVHTCGTRREAEVAKTTLEAAGIQAMIQADTAGGMREHLAWSGAGHKILVREEAAEAREVLAPPPEDALTNETADFPSDSAGPPPTWRRFT